jgi:hypothetical protein
MMGKRKREEGAGKVVENVLKQSTTGSCSAGQVWFEPGEDVNVVYGASSSTSILSWMSERWTFQVGSVSNLQERERKQLGKMEI